MISVEAISGRTYLPDVRAGGARDAELLAVLEVVRSQLPTSQFKDPLSDRVRIVMSDTLISSEHWRVAPRSLVRLHQSVDSGLLLDGESAHALLSRAHSRVHIDLNRAVVQSDEDDH